MEFDFGDYPMKWYKALVFVLMPIVLIGQAIGLFSNLVRLSFGDWLGVLGFDSYREIAAARLLPFHIIGSALFELLGVAIGVLLFFAWYNLIKLKKRGIKLFLNYLIINGVVSTFSAILSSTVNYELQIGDYVFFGRGFFHQHGPYITKTVVGGRVFFVTC